MLGFRRRIFSLLVFIIFVVGYSANAQIVEVESTTEGIVFPRVNTTSDVTAPVEGTVVYQTTDPKGLYQFDGSSWSIIGGAGGGSESEYFLMIGWVSGASSTRWTFLNSGFSGSEGSAQVMMPFDGVLKNFSIRPVTVVSAGATATFTVRKNSSDTNLQLSFEDSDGTSLKEDTDEVIVNKGDLVTIRMDETSGVSTSTYFAISLKLE